MIVALYPVRDLKRYYMDLEDRIDIWHVVAKEVAPPPSTPHPVDFEKAWFLAYFSVDLSENSFPPPPQHHAQTQVAKELQKRCAAGLKENF